MPDQSNEVKAGDAKPKKSAALRQRARPATAVLSSAALAGAEAVVARSAFGGATVPMPSPELPEDSARATSMSTEATSDPAAHPQSTRSDAPVPERGQPDAATNLTSASGSPLAESPNAQSQDVAPPDDEPVRAAPLATEPSAATDRGETTAGASQPTAEVAEHNGARDLGALQSDEDDTVNPRSPSQGDVSSAPPSDDDAMAQKKTAAKRRRAPSAQAALLHSFKESGIDLRLSMQRWGTTPFRFAPELQAEVNARLAQDRVSSGHQLTVAQYVDAAMALMLPSTIEEQLDLAEAYLRERPLTSAGTGKQSSHRVSPEVYAVASALPNNLRGAGRARTAIHVWSAAMRKFLDALEAEGPLPPAL
jgi:hypothetical protein